MAGANVSPGCMVADVRSNVEEVNTPNPKPPEPILIADALAQLLLPGWAYAVVEKNIKHSKSEAITLELALYVNVSVCIFFANNIATVDD
jgi:hypothetical protein